MLQLLLVHARSSGATQNLWHMSCVGSWQIQHSILANPIWQKDCPSDNEYVCQNPRHGLLICCHAAAVAILSLKFGHTSDPHSRELHAETPLRYSQLSCNFPCRVFPGLWLKFRHNWDLQSSPEWCSWICMKPMLTICDSLWTSHFSPGMPQEQQLCHQCVCTAVHSALSISIYIILFICSSTLD